MISLCAREQEKNYFVLGTTNYIEFKVGYFTKYGDGAADHGPLRNLQKEEGKEIAMQLGVPEEIIDRGPTAGLYEKQADEDEIGVTYETRDDQF